MYRHSSTPLKKYPKNYAMLIECVVVNASPLNGQGIAHPRGLGIASHIGVLLDIPTIGCAKSRLIGTFKKPGKRKGEWAPLMQHGNTIGAVLRARDNVRPVFVSPGHRIDIQTSVDIIVHCTGDYRVPLPQRCADIFTKKAKQKILEGVRN